MNDGKLDDIILIGMPTVGKSSYGVVLAKALGLRFIDSDLVIQEKTGKMLNQLIAELGNDGFLKLENDINCSIDDNKAVIATGGSAVYGRQAMEHFKQIGRIVYLMDDPDVIKERLLDPKGRGVTMRAGQTIDDLFAERKPLYEKYADIKINVNGKSPDEIVTGIIAELESNI